MERNEAIEIVKNHLPNSSFKILREALETLIPELAESEDELMRKEAISIIKQYNIICEREGDKCWTADRVIAWLENQDRQMIAKGERKNVALSIINYLDNNRVEGCMDLSSMECEDIEDACVNSKWTKLYNYMKKKLEKQDTPKDYRSIDPYFLKPIETTSKFKVGDWAAADRINFRSPTKIVDILDTEYRVEDTKGNSGMPKIDYFDSRYHLWSIDDVKDGDVLISAYGQPFIYNGNRNSSYIGAYGGVTTIGLFKAAVGKCFWTRNINIHPATKKQQNYLFQKMREAGYMWDSYTKSVFCSINRNPND